MHYLKNYLNSTPILLLVGVVPLIEMTVAQICTAVGYPAMSVLFGLTIF